MSDAAKGLVLVVTLLAVVFLAGFYLASRPDQALAAVLGVAAGFALCLLLVAGSRLKM